jgi:hypothetical protein
MSPRLRSIVATAAGILTGVVVISAVEAVSNNMYPLPAGVNPKDLEALRAVILSMPDGAFLMIMLGHMLGALAAGIVSMLIAKDTFRPTLVCGGMFMFFGLINLIALPHPLFVWAELVGYIPLAYLGAKLVRKN